MADYFDPTLEEEDGEEDNTYTQRSTEYIVFLVDMNRGMFERANIVAEGYEEEDTFVVAALKVVKELLKRHIIGSPKDKIAISFYGTRVSKNASEFPAIYSFQELQTTTAKSIKAVEQLQPRLEEDIGSSPLSETVGSLRDALWTASHLLNSGTLRVAKRVVILTNNENPLLGEDEISREQVLSRSQNLKEAGVEIQLLCLAAADKPFSMDFWKNVLHSPDDDEDIPSDPQRLEDFALNVRQKVYKKRSLGSLPLTLGRDFVVNVKIYALLQKAGRSKVVKLHRGTNELLVSEGAFICSDTGAILETVPKFSFPKAGTAPRFPKLIMGPETKTLLKATLPPGLYLIGFKPLGFLKPYHQLRSSNFLYPDEKLRPGSTKVLVALHEVLLKRDLFALCSTARLKLAQPRFVAVLPQQEELTEFGAQVTPPGFQMIWLPFADDIRRPEEDIGFVGGSPHPAATETQISAAKQLLEKLQLQDFAPGYIPNPHIQRHYQVIEALALGESPPEFDPKKDDLSYPDETGMQNEAKDAIIEFKVAIYGSADAGPAAPSLKRKADAEAIQAINFKDLAKKGMLHKLTVAQLREFCKANGLPTPGRKDEIITRVSEFLKE